MARLPIYCKYILHFTLHTRIITIYVFTRDDGRHWAIYSLLGHCAKYNFLVVTIYVDCMTSLYDYLSFCRSYLRVCAGVPYPFFNACRDSIGLSTVINTRYVFFRYFSLPIPKALIIAHMRNPRNLNLPFFQTWWIWHKSLSGSRATRLSVLPSWTTI